jgi:hypothetical protein
MEITAKKIKTVYRYIPQQEYNNGIYEAPTGSVEEWSQTKTPSEIALESWSENTVKVVRAMDDWLERQKGKTSKNQNRIDHVSEYRNKINERLESARKTLCERHYLREWIKRRYRKKFLREP